MQRNISSFFSGSLKRKEQYVNKYDRHRAIKSEWFKIFHWLIHAKDENMFRCKSCVETKQNNIFVTGKDATKPKKDDFIKHQKSNDHKASILAKTDKMI